MKYDVTKGGYILLGRCGENLARTVEIDVSEYLAEYPGAVVTLLHRRHGESGIYPVAAELRDGCLVWQPTSADTAIAGSGEAEVRVTVNGVLAKSKILSTMVDKSLTGHETEAPEPGMDWVDKITTAIGNVQNMKAEAESVAYGEPATAEYDGKTGTMHFGIPEGRPGRDASVTAENIKSALGYTPADKVVVDQLTQEIAELKGEKKEPATYVPDLAGYLKNDGTFANYSTCFHTDYIPLEGYVRISAKAYLVTTGYALAFFDSNKTLLKNLSIAGLGGTGKPNIIDMDVPSEAAYCILSNFFGSGNTNTDTFLTLYPEETDTPDEHLTGVTVNVLGDSISSVAYTTPNYWQLIAEKTGCMFNDYAVSGSRIATVEGDNKESFLTRASRMDTSADAVLVMGGTNDCNLRTLLGEWNSTDESTFYGALNALITLLRSNFQGKPIIFCTPIKRKYDRDNGFPDTVTDLKTASATEQITMQHCVLAIKAKCACHGIPVIDLAEHSGFSALTPEYYRAEDDNLHPSALGFMRIANMVQPELEKQFAYKPD